MKYKNIFVISPPFYSHFNPLLNLAKSFQKFGARVTMGCSVEFKQRIEDANLEFYELDISSNKNTGNANLTTQPDSEEMRLNEFFEATKEGAIETLITQSRHRKSDMLYNPQILLNNIKDIDENLDIDLWLVDILSYSVTLSLYVLDLNFITFCPPHPNTIPSEEAYFNVPKNWPPGIRIDESRLDELKRVSNTTSREFTDVFNKILRENNSSLKEIKNAFNLVSKEAVIYNYFDFYNNEDFENKPYEIFICNSFEEEILDKIWFDKIRKYKKKILISLGTFLSNRVDVLEKLILASSKYDDAIVIVSAGNNAKNLEKYQSSNVIIESFIPQKALMPYMDIIIHHGGCNTFTEAMYYSIPMIILPFSSDQFNIAYDVWKNKIGEILDPNNLNENDILKAIKDIDTSSQSNLKYWSQFSKSKGPDYAVKFLLELS